MSGRVLDEISRFDHLASQIEKLDKYSIEYPISRCMLLTPKSGRSSSSAKGISFTVMALTHGNEVAGLTVVNYFMEQIVTGALEIQIPIAILLGNVDAASVGLRYLERDLNRSFNHKDTAIKEVQRAAEIQGVLDNTFLLLDIHQTKENSETPFFIFPYSSSGFNFAVSISKDIPVVTHWGAPFSKEGQCTDEYTNEQGGCGITLEIGQNGFHPFHVGAGFMGLMRAYQCALQCWPEAKFPVADQLDIQESRVFTFAKILPYPTEGTVELKKGLMNFTEVQSQDILAKIDNQEEQAEFSGPVLFPQYMRHGEKNRPAELVRILRQIDLSELPSDR